MIIDTHVHLGGCISPTFVWDVIQKQNLKYLAETYDDVVAQMTFGSDETKDFHRFLDKFRILDSIIWNEELIDSSIESVCAFYKSLSLDYIWLDFSINKYMDIGWHKKDAILFIHESFSRHMPNQVGLILSIKYESPRTSQKQYLKIIEDPDIHNCLFGVDLVGDESYYDHTFYAPLFEDWVKTGKVVRAHVGESQSYINVQTAIKSLNVTNIAHGIRAVDCTDTLKLAADSGVTFDMAISSNYATNVVVGEHPILPIMKAGVKVTIGSDDPVQCGSTILTEYESCPTMGINDTLVHAIKNTAISNTAVALQKQGRMCDLRVLNSKIAFC